MHWLTRVYGMILPLVPTGPPEGVSGTATSSSSIHLTWSPPSPEQQNGEIQTYLIRVIEVATGQVDERYSSQESVTITSLHPYHTYNCSISAMTTNGTGPHAIVEVTTQEAGEKFSLHHACLTSMLQHSITKIKLVR